MAAGIGGLSDFRDFRDENGPGSRVRLPDQPLLANWWCLFNVKPFPFWVVSIRKHWAEHPSCYRELRCGRNQKIKSSKSRGSVGRRGRHLPRIVLSKSPPNLAPRLPLFPFYMLKTETQRRQLLSRTSHSWSRQHYGRPEVTHFRFLLQGLAQNASLFTQLFLVPTGRLPWAPGKSPTEKKKKKKAHVRNLDVNLTGSQGAVLLLLFGGKRVWIIATKEQRLAFVYFLAWVVFKKKILGDDPNYWIIMRSEKSYLV